MPAQQLVAVLMAADFAGAAMAAQRVTSASMYRKGNQLRRRIVATRWPKRETVTDESQDVPLATMQELARYWVTEYDCANARRN